MFLSNIAVAAVIAFPLNISVPQHLNTEHANRYSIYAMMSSNAYLRDPIRTYFPIRDLGWVKVDLNSQAIPQGIHSYKPNTRIGKIFSNLQFDIWEQQGSNKTIIAFKGTDEVIDWGVANFAIGISIPYKSAKKKVKEYIRNNPTRYISLTGHSLGGGLALSVSVWEGIDAVVFNTSPRVFDGFNNDPKPASRKAIFQEDDILQKIREFYPTFEDAVSPGNIIKTNFDYNGESNHRADLIAEGILRCARDSHLIMMAAKLTPKVQCNF